MAVGAAPRPSIFTLKRQQCFSLACRPFKQPVTVAVGAYANHFVGENLLRHVDMPPGDGWSARMPDSVGQWDMTSAETDFETDRVTIFERNGELWVTDPHLGDNPLERYHHGLTNLRWRKVQASCAPQKFAAPQDGRDLND